MAVSSKSGKYEPSKTTLKPKNSYDSAGVISRIYCLYVFQFLYRHYKKDFHLDAIDPVARDDQCDRLGSNLGRYWNLEITRQQNGNGKASLLRAIWKCFGAQFLFQNVKSFMSFGIFRMGMPVILGRIVHYSNRYFEEKIDYGSNFLVNGTKIGADESDLLNQWLPLSNRENVILNCVFLGIVIFANFCIGHPYYMCKYRYGMNVRVAVTRLVYEKALRVTNQTVQRISTGKIVNLISNDVNRFDIAYFYVSYVYMALLEAAVGMYLLWQYIGASSLGTLTIIAFFIPFQSLMANILSRFRSASIALTDDRLRLMTEILPAMRVIKMYAWELPFSRLVHVARKLEITKIRHSMILRSINLGLFFVASKLMSFVAIILFLLNGGQLNAEIVFVTMALIAQIREVMTSYFPMAISTSVEMYISIKRIEKFLLEEEVEDYLKLQQNQQTIIHDKSPRITFDQVSVKADLDESSITILKDISFDVVPGKLAIIIGPVGSGKSSVLLSALNELPVSGSVQVNGKLIYASQEAWIFSGTVRDNILFGREYDPVRYRDVVRVAALSKDFQQFDQGDATVVDDRGTSLSGGQRARISLARAIYANADCYLLDDPLSAVDASVAKHIFERCITEYLSDKCVILVTHQLQFIKRADQIVVLKDGAMLGCGSYLELLNRGIDVFKYSASATEQLRPADENPAASEYATIHSPSLRIRKGSIRYRVDSYCSSNRTNSFTSDTDCGEDKISILDYNGKDNPPQLAVESNPQISTNQNSESSVQQQRNKLKIYWQYISAGAGILLFLTFLSTNIITQVLFTGSDYWLSAWTDYQEKSHIQSVNQNYTFVKNPIVAEGQQANILIYSAIVLVLFAFSIIRTVAFFVICMRSSVNLHNRIFTSLIQAPIVFFDKTPIGIIINRVSADLGIIDDLLPPTAFEAIEILGTSLGVFILCSVLNFFVIVPFLILIILIYFTNRFYVNTARKLKRLEGVARSPLFNQLAATLSGLTTIRSYGAEEIFVKRFSDTQDLHTSTFFTFLSANRFYGIVLESFSVTYIYALMAVMNIFLDNYTGSIIGLTISQSLMLIATFNFGCRRYTEAETYMTSVERIIEFGQLEQEELNKAHQEPPDDWPSMGDITYKDVSLYYNQDSDNKQPKAVLQNICFSIAGGEKIGIVGRTGAGKSSLITTLFRLTQPIGSIAIDGIDTGDISLTKLRKSISIIPQEPILFSGNIRHNLDPFNEKSDSELWDTIEKVQLKEKIQSFPEKLDNQISESGSDFSVGQKQLICLARAILRKNRIMILDEATANVDPRTDGLIQQTIRTEFAHCTVLTIAHRLNTIIDYDRVMVLDAGRLSQFGSPYELIKQKEGIFYELYSNLNKDTKMELKKLARKAHKDKAFKNVDL